MKLAETIYGRRSTRAFSQQPVTTSLLERLIDSAIQAPSARNQQPWEFVIIQNSPLRRSVTVDAAGRSDANDPLVSRRDEIPALAALHAGDARHHAFARARDRACLRRPRPGAR